jgi:hypothetical protein
MATLTLSVIKADVGGFVGHSACHEALLDEARTRLAQAQAKGEILDFYVTACGDDLQLILTHTHGTDHPGIHHLAWDVFKACTEVARRLKLYGAGQDLLADAFSGNVRGMGPGVAEMTLEERPSEPVIIFMADKTSAGAWNLPLYKMFADPFNTAGLVISPAMHDGFRFEVHDVKESRRVFFDTPEELYDLLAFRVIVRNKAECYEALGYIHALWPPIPGKFNDYIAMPKPNGYQSLHTTVFGPRKKRMEVQIRTERMHRMAEEGIAAHWRYKEGKVVQDKEDERLAWVRQLLDWQQELDDPREFLDMVKVELFPDEVYVLTPTGGVLQDTLTLAFYLYNKGFRDSDFSYASAIAMVTFLIILVLTLVQRRILERRVNYEI